MPPRLLISATARWALFVADGPQMPGEPVLHMNPPIRSLLLALRRLRPERSAGDIARATAGGERFLNNSDGGNATPPGAGKFTDERTPTPVWDRTNGHSAGGRGIRPLFIHRSYVENIEFS